MNHYSLRSIFLVACCFLLAACARDAQTSPPEPGETVTLTVLNQSEQAICYVYVSPVTSNSWGSDWLDSDIIKIGETYDVFLTPSVYDVLLQDCDSNVLLEKYQLTIDDNLELPLTEIDIRSAACSTYTTEGEQAYHQGQYAEALITLQIGLSCYQDAGNGIGQARMLHDIGLIYHGQGRYTDALVTYEQALALQQEMDDRAGEGKTLNSIGAVYYDQSRYREALEVFEQALMIRREVDDRRGEAITLNSIASVYDNYGRNSEALDSYEKALTILREIGDQRSEAIVLDNIASAYHRLGRYGDALDRQKQALAILQNVGALAEEVPTLNNMATVYQNQGRYNEALTTYEQALTLSRAVGDRAGEGHIFSNMAVIFQAQGRYGEALEYNEQALTIRHEVGDQIGEGITLNNIGGIYQTQEQHSKAIEQYEKALVIFQEVGDLPSQSITLNNIAGVYHVQAQHDEALATYQQALAIQQTAGILANAGATLNNIGEVYSSQNRYSEALATFDQALVILQAVEDPDGEATVLNNIGGVYQEQRDYDKAMVSYKQALTIWQDIGDRASEGIALINIGLTYDYQGHNDKALEAYLLGVSAVEYVRVGAGNDLARTSFVERFIPLYDRIIAILQQQDAVAQAFWYSERGRAQVLLDTITTGQVQLNDNNAAALLTAEQEAYAIRQSAQDALAKAKALNPPDPALVANLETQISAAEREYEAALSAIQSRRDQLMDLVPGRNNNVLTLDEVQALLDDHTTLISYWMLGDNTLAFLITADDVSVVELPNATTDKINATVDGLYAWNNPDNPHPRPLRNLYQWLVEPLTPHLHTSHVTIIPHQSLHYVPFAALTDGQTYFGEQYLLTQLPSASVLPFLNENAAKAEQNKTGGAVILGNPVTELSALPYAEDEATEVADFFGTTVYTGTAASELQLRTVVSGASVLHLAAHGSYNAANALYSAIALATDEDEAYDGLLETHEIFGLPLQGNDLVTLSACETNVGAISRGDEVVGLTRAFFFAGSPTVISSLWNVDDSATGVLMTAFYRHWKDEGMSKAEALQAAQADVRADPRWVSPFYWAGFVLNGHPGKSHAE